ncbi:MAG: flagellar motor switch protein FliN [Alphaproteobacteria bacterium]
MDETENLELSDLDTETTAPPEAVSAEPILDSNEIDALDAGQEVLPADGEDPELNAAGLGAVYDIPVQIAAVLGTSQMQVSQLLKLGRGAVVELDRKVGEAIDIYVNNRLVARGEVVVVNERLGVTMTEIIKAD